MCGSHGLAVAAVVVATTRRLCSQTVISLQRESAPINTPMTRAAIHSQPSLQSARKRAVTASHSMERRRVVLFCLRQARQSTSSWVNRRLAYRGEVFCQRPRHNGKIEKCKESPLCKENTQQGVHSLVSGPRMQSSDKSVDQLKGLLAAFSISTIYDRIVCCCCCWQPYGTKVSILEFHTRPK